MPEMAELPDDPSREPIDDEVPGELPITAMAVEH